VPGYLDWASTAPLHPAAAEVLGALVDGLSPADEPGAWADPMRLYGSARRVRAALDAAREQVAGVLGARADEVQFPPSAVAAVDTALIGALEARSRVSRRLVHSSVEHSSVLAVARERAESVPVPVDAVGRVVGFEVGPGDAVASLQHANHEVGTIQPVEAVGAACAEAGVPLHVDASVTLGRIDPPVGWSLLTAAAHLWGGPPGVGVLAVRTGTRWRSPWPEDERGYGFENVPFVLAAAAALVAREDERRAEAVRLSALVDRIRRELPLSVPDVDLVGDPDPVGRVPHLLTFSCLYVEGEALLAELDRAGIAVSSGSSCTSSALTPSHVLVAMGALTHGNIRVSMGRTTTDDDVDLLLSVLPAAVERLRS
jgi:cysteine desulfurase